MLLKRTAQKIRYLWVLVLVNLNTRHRFPGVCKYISILVSGVGSGVSREWEMAEYLASIFDTEKDKVNCSFYFKIGACRHGDRCSRLHNKPTFSQTVALLNIYRNPQNSSQSADGLRCAVSNVEMQEHYDEFFEEVFTEMEEKYGEVEEMNVCDNLGDHLVGNVYVKFRAKKTRKRL